MLTSLKAIGFTQSWQGSTTPFSSIAEARQSGDWSEYHNRAQVPPGINQTFWLKNKLGYIPLDSGLFFDNGLEDIEVYVDGEIIFSYGDFSSGFKEVPTQTWHLIPLKPYYANKEIYVRLHYSYFHMTKTLYPRIEKVSDVLTEKARSSFGNLWFSGFFGTCGFLGFLLFLTERKRGIVLYYTIISVAGSVWVLVNQDSTLKSFITFDPNTMTLIDVCSITLGTAAVFAFFHNATNFQSRVLGLVIKAQWTVAFSSVFLSILQLMGIPLLSPWYLLTMLHLAILPAGISSVFQLLKQFKGHEEARYLFSAIAVVTFSGIHDTLRYIPNFPTVVESAIPFGILAATGILGYIVYKRRQAEKERFIREIQDLNESLEDRVVERTRDIRSILKNLPQGVFQIGEQSGLTILDEYSDSLRTIIGTSNIEGQNPMGIVFAQTDLKEEQKSVLENSLRCAIGEEIFQWEVNSHILPGKFRMNEKFLDVDWQPIADDEGVVEKVLVSIKDVTEIHRLEKEANLQSQKSQIITKIINLEIDQIFGFIETANSLLKQVRDAIASNNFNLIFRHLHTIKGNARTLGLDDISGLTHNAETQLTKLKDKEDYSVLLEDVNGIQDLLNTYYSTIRSIYKLDTKKITVNKDQLEDIYDSLTTANLGDLADKVRLMFEPNLEKTIQSEVASLERTAKRLNKKPVRVEFKNDRFGIPPHLGGLCKKVFVHLLTNAIDHGIETPDERQQKGKDPRGEIVISVKRELDNLLIDISDDGKGLDIDKIRLSAVQKKIISSVTPISDSEVAQLIFSSGFSTAKELSAISGRGVGLEAVKAYLEEIGGSISVELVDKIGEFTFSFRFVLTLPIHQKAELAS